jgi:hypothetical protein
VAFSPVYSAAFIEYTPETPNQQFLVPPGFTAVVRQCSCYQNIGAFLFYCEIQNSEDAPALVFFAGHQEGDVNYVSGQGRWVCPENGVITAAVDTIGTTISMYVGGYLLRNTLT